MIALEKNILQTSLQTSQMITHIKTICIDSNFESDTDSNIY